jgi:hypothetical protein
MNPRVTWAAELFALFAVGLASLACSRPDPPPPPPPTPPLEVDRETLAEAMHECFTIDCDRARDLAAQISPNSPLRQTDEFHAIEYRHEVNAFLRAENETDFDKQRAMLATLRDTTDAVPEIRAAAAQLLARLGGGRRFELVLAGHPDAGTDAGADAKAELSARIALLMKSKTPGDYEAARSLVEPRIYSGEATPDDVRTMTTICKAQKDTRCLKTLKTLKLH